MGIVTIDSSKPLVLNWAAKSTERIIQNVYNIINTFKYEVAYNRDMGISPDFIDTDAETMKGIIMDSLYESISKYEPRATVKSVEVQGVTTEGEVSVVVEIEV